MTSLSFLAMLAVGIVTTAAATKISEPQEVDCDVPGWYFHEGHCYLIDPIHFVPMDWESAVDFCPNAHEDFPEAYLVEIVNHEEQQFIYYIVLTMLHLGYDTHYWTGGNDLVHDGEWEWEHSRLPFNYTAWEPDEPEGNGDCMVFGPHYNDDYLTWEDWACVVAWPPICKAPHKPALAVDSEA